MNVKNLTRTERDYTLAYSFTKKQSKMKKVFLAFAVVFAGLAVNAQGTAAKQESKPAAVKSEAKAPAKSAAVRPTSPITEAKSAASTEVKHAAAKTEAKPAAHTEAKHAATHAETKPAPAKEATKEAPKK